jgi:uncharacterized protein YlxW (UPF0749 family)
MTLKTARTIDPTKLHKTQLITQIYIPLVLVSILVLGTGLLITLKSTGEASISQTWASMGVLMLITPLIILSIFSLTILILAVIGMSKANRVMPKILRDAGYKLVGINETSQKYINNLASPVIKTRSVSAGVKGLFEALKNRLRRS